MMHKYDNVLSKKNVILLTHLHLKITEALIYDKYCYHSRSI